MCACEGMVVHPSPGHTSGTLVNAVLFHCGLPAVSMTDAAGGTDDEALGAQATGSCVSDDHAVLHTAAQHLEQLPTASPTAAVLRPGIVHRLDKGVW